MIAIDKRIRRAVVGDLDFLVDLDLEIDGYPSSYIHTMSPMELTEQRNKIKKYIVEQDKGTLIMVDNDNGKPIGVIMYCISNRDVTYPWKTGFSELDRGLFQADGRFLEIFNLWVDSDYRRQGIAMFLKRKLEDEARRHGVKLIYTHTKEENEHVIELNRKLGYREVRRGPIWDDEVRVSLFKHL